MIQEIMRLLTTDSLAAADAIDALAERLHNHAEAIRSSGSFKSPGGMADRVKMAVVGPSGEQKQYIDTGL